jgi:ferredoxin
MASELTPDEVRAIEERHKKGAMYTIFAPASQEQRDIGALLDLLRTVARVVFAREDLDKSTCEVCGGRGLCVADCPAGLLGALREGVLAGSGHFAKRGPRRTRTSEPKTGHFGPNPASTREGT